MTKAGMVAFAVT